MYHDVFFNTTRRDTYLHASPERTGLSPTRGVYWGLQNGTPGSAMQLKALSQAPAKITRHPKTTRQLENKQKPKPNNPNPCNHPFTRNCEVAFLPTSDIRGRRGGIWRARHSTRICPIPTPPSPNTIHKTAPQVPSPTDTRRPILKSYGEREA